MDLFLCVWVGGGHGKNDSITISITNTGGAKSPTFEKWQKKSISARWTFFAILWSV
jgi:hypothetical protein